MTLAGCGDRSASTNASPSTPTATDAKAAATPGAGPGRRGPPTTLITVARVERRTLEITEDTVGSLENVIDPRVAAEVAGRVVRVFAQQGQAIKQGQLLAEIDSQDFVIQNRTDEAELARLQTILDQQDRLVDRQQRLVQQGFISQNAVDDAIANRNAQREQIVAARARNDATKNSLRKARVLSPINGRVQEQVVTEGDYVKVGEPLFHLVGTIRLVAHLPFPENALNRLKIGMPVRITSPLAPGALINARIDEIRPTVTASSRSLDIIVKFDSDERMRGGGTVNAAVVTASRPDVVMVAEESVVLRPAGKVVYVVTEGLAMQRVVETGAKRDGRVEIIKGLEGGETIALDGAGFLTNNAAVSLPKPAAAAKSGDRRSGSEPKSGGEAKDGGEGKGGSDRKPAAKAEKQQ